MHVVAIAFIATLVICLIYILYTRFMQWFKSKKIEENWPPVVNPCPDFWVQSSDGTKCSNTLGVGDLPRNSKFNALVKGATKKSDMKVACMWAIRNGVPWEGVDNKC